MRKLYILLLTVLFAHLLSAQVNVAATAGTFNATYTTLKGAFDAVNAGTHGGIVSITITANTTETATAVLNSGTVAPASYSGVIVTPAAPVVVSGTITGAVIKLNGADNVIIDGSIGGGGTDRSLTIQNNSTATSTAAIWLASVSVADGCSNNVIRSLEIKTGIDASTSNNSTFGIIMCGIAISTTSNGVSNDNNSFINNRITKCRFGIVTRGTTSDLNLNPVVTDNIIGDNTFGADQVAKTGILMQADQGALVSRNTIQYVGCLATQAQSGADRNGIAIGTDSWGISPGTLTGNTYTITNNIIHDVVEEKTFSSLGINLGATGGGSPTNNIVANNFIYNVRANGTGNDQTAGIGIAGGHTDKVVYNSIYLSGDVDPGTAAATTNFGSGIRIANPNGATHANLTLMNNIVYVNLTSSSTAAVRFYAISGTSATYSFGTGGENYNDYFINTANTQLQTGGLGTSSGNTLTVQFATLANWQTAYATAQDGNSIQADPVFLSATNLHINTVSAVVDGKATPITGITTDIDGDTRDGTIPDIGADEYVSSAVPCVVPPDQPSAFITGTITGTSIAGSFTPAVSAPSGYIVIRSAGAFSGTLVNGTTYGTGTIIGNGTVVQSSPSTSFTASGLTGNTGYTLTIAAYNTGTCLGGPLYNTTNMLTGNAITCPQTPGSLTTSALTSSSFTLSWASSAGGGALPVSYTIDVATDAAFTLPVAGSPFSVFDPAISQNLSGLTANTIYYYRVSASNGCSSAFATGNVTTDCAAFTPPYLETFTSYLPTCWTEKAGHLSVSSVLTGTSSVWVQDGWLNSGSTGAAKINLDFIGDKDWLISPTIDLGAAGNYQLEFDLATMAFNSSINTSVLGSDDSLAVVISTDNGATWANTNILALYTAANTPVSATGLHVTVPLNAYTGLVKIGFYGSEGIIDDVRDVDVMIDNVAVNLLPLCGSITGLAASNITVISADINWNVTPGATGYEYMINTSPVPPVSGTPVAVNSASATGLTGSTVYYAHVRSVCGAGMFGSWQTITFSTPVANDDCINATAFPAILPDGNCVTLTNQSTIGATQSMAACTGTGADDDVWFSFVAPATSVIIQLTNVSGSTDRVHQVFSGNCGTLTSIICSDPETSTVAGLTVGQTYYVRVHTYSGGVSSVFNICIKTPPPCASPTVLSAGTVTSTTAVLNWTENGLGTTWDIEVQPAPFVFTGVPTVTGVTRPYTITGLLPVTGYQFRVRATTCPANWSASSATFTTLGVPPPNDDAPGAILLTPGTCSGSPFTNLNATQGVTEPNPSCKSTGGFNTVWYKFVAPASGMVKISNDYAGGTLGSDTRLALFSATDVNDYSTFTILACDDDNGATVATRSIIYMARLVPGSTYYIQVSGYSTFTTAGTFCLSVEELNSSMISPVTACISGQSLTAFNDNYNGWVSAVDNNGKLIAQLRNGTGAGAGTSTYSLSQHINPGPVRNNAGVKYLDRNYFVSNPAVSNVDVQFFFLQSEMTALSTEDPTALLATMGATRQGGASCIQNFATVNGTTSFLPQGFSATTADGNASFIQVQTPSFSNFYLQSNGVAVLPVSLLTFAGQKEGTVNKLKWTTASEQNNRGFEVQRSADGMNFTSIGFVSTLATGGNSTGELHYTFTDNNPAGTKQYYRLRQVDLDNQSRFSKVVFIKGERPATLIVDGLYPNPASTELNVIVATPVHEKVTLLVTDITGKSVLQKTVTVEAGSNTIPVDISRLTKGSYIVKLVCESNCENAAGKFVKQ